MSIDKSIFQAPEGLEQLTEEPIEIEVVEAEFELTPDEPEVELNFDDNLAEILDERVLSTMASDILDEIDDDLHSRKDWEKAYIDGLKLLGLKIEDRTEPWDGACGVFHPMITEAVVRFQSETITETFPAAGPVRTKLIGKETPKLKQAAARVENDMNYQLTEVMREFRPEHERMMWSLPATGSAFKKVYFDPSLNRQVSTFVTAEDIILPYGVSDISMSHRVTHRMRKTKNEIVKLQKAGFYREIDLPGTTKSVSDIQKAKDKETGFTDIADERYELYECHVDLIIPSEDDDDGDQIALPYVFTIIKDSGDVLALRRNWKEDDELKLKRNHFVHYQYIPGFGAYGFGLFHLIGGFAKSSTSILRQLVDAGTLSNLPGGLKSRGLRIKGDDTPIAPGEWRDVDVAGGVIRDNILPLPYKEPSAVLAGLLDKIVEEGRRFASTADLQVGDMSANAPVGTTLALLERQLKVMTAVQARTHYSFKQELQLIAGIIRDYADEDYDYTPDTADFTAKKSDYACCEILPVSDPNAATLSQRVVQYQAVIQMAQMAPDIYDMPQLHRAMLEVMGIKNAEKLVPLPDDMVPEDPVTENQNLLKIEPVKAFFYQDHDSHIAVHTSMLQDPLIQQAIGQNPKAAAIQAAITAHIAEHAGYRMRNQIEQKLGVPLPPESVKMPPEIEVALSGMMAQAASQALAQNQQQAAQQQAQQQAQDPVLQLQQKDLDIKEKALDIKSEEVAIKRMVAQQDGVIKQMKAELEKQRAQLDAFIRTGTLKISGIKTAADAKAAEDRNEIEGLRFGIDIAKHHADRQDASLAAQMPPEAEPEDISGDNFDTPLEGTETQ